MKFFGILKIGPLEPCGNDFQSTGSHRLTVYTSTDSYYYFSAYTWWQKRNTFPQGSSGSIFKIPMNPQNQQTKQNKYKNTRNFEKYFVNHSNTKRHQNSSIIHMQTILNSNEAELKRIFGN